MPGHDVGQALWVKRSKGCSCRTCGPGKKSGDKVRTAIHDFENRIFLAVMTHSDCILSQPRFLKPAANPLGTD